MHKYIPHVDSEMIDMLKTIGINKIDDLFVDIPKNVKVNGLNLPQPLSELELTKKLNLLAEKNQPTDKLTCFLGAGVYDHYIPSVVDNLISRQEFYTSYTPYQPEISQGNLQAIFEYQSMICELTGTDLANASMYDGATAAAEAVNVACSTSKKNGILVATSVNPQTKKVIQTYNKYLKRNIYTLEMADGLIDINDLENKLTLDIGAVIIQTPNFFGLIEDIGKIAEIVHKSKAFLIVSADPISLALLEAPGKLGADMVVGEGQSLGNSLSFGGPHVGFFSANSKLMRKIPGRIVGETKDADGKRAFVLTIQTREQHIRREKATSNICSNHALNALAACIYMSTLGKQGLKEVATQCLQKSHYAYKMLLATNKFTPVFSGSFFKEFTLKYQGDVSKLNKYLLANNILGGYCLDKDYPDMDNCYLIAVTEKRTKEEIDQLAHLIGKGDI